MRKSFERIFIFTKREQRGLMILLFLSVFVVVAKWVWISRQPDSNFRFEQDSTLVSFLASLEEDSSSPVISSYTGVAMDLNKASGKDLLKLGFSEKLCETFLRFRKAGAVFHSVSDVRKIYGMNDDLWERIAPYVYFPDPPDRETEKTDVASEILEEPDGIEASGYNTPLLVNLNTADTFQLMKIPGIGNVFAKRILGYRELLGGYVAKKQLLEVYGMTSERFSQCTSYVSIQDQPVRKLSLNKADYVTLLRHPYLNQKQVQTLLAFRAYTDSTITYEGLIENRVLDTADLRKILPYLGFDK